MLHFVLLLVSAFNFQEDPKTNLLAILIGVGSIFLWLIISGGVYTNKYVNALEGSFVLNLIILTAITYCVNLFRGNQLILGYTWTISVSIAFATFIGILVFQLANVTGKYLKRKYAALKVATINRNKAKAEPRSPTDSLPDRLLNPDNYEPLLYIPQGHAKPTEGANEAQRRPLMYTYGLVTNGNHFTS